MRVKRNHVLPQALTGWTLLYYKFTSMCAFVYTPKFTLLLPCTHGYACVYSCVNTRVCRYTDVWEYMCIHICMSMCMLYIPAHVCRYKTPWECMGAHMYGYASVCTRLSACVHKCVFLSVNMQVHYEHRYQVCVSENPK